MDELALVISAIHGVKTRIRVFWPVEQSDHDAVMIGIACALNYSRNVIDMICSRHSTILIQENVQTIRFNAEEFVVSLKVLSTRIATIGSLADDALFAELVVSMESALRSTLSEPLAKQLWLRPTVRVAAALSFLGAAEPLVALDVIFGSVVRADARRCEDLHFSHSTIESNPRFVFDLCHAAAATILL